MRIANCGFLFHEHQFFHECLPFEFEPVEIDATCEAGAVEGCRVFAGRSLFLYQNLDFLPNGVEYR